MVKWLLKDDFINYLSLMKMKEGMQLRMDIMRSAIVKFIRK